MIEYKELLRRLRDRYLDPGGVVYTAEEQALWFEVQDAISIRPKVAVVTFAEGYFEDLMWFDNIATAKAFKQGFGMCSGHYGGTGQSYALPDDLDEMREDESDKYTSLKKGEVDKAIAMMERNNT